MSRRPRWILLLVGTALLAGCASMGPPREGGAEPAEGEGGAPAPRAERPRTEAPPSRLVERARTLVERDRTEEAARLADSLYFQFRAAHRTDEASLSLDLAARARLAAGDTALAAKLLTDYLTRYPDARGSGEAALQLARLRLDLGEDPGAAEVLLEHRPGEDERSGTLLTRAARHMSVSELEELIDGRSGRISGGMLSLLRDELERARKEAAAEDAVRIGLLLPSSGRLASVGRWIREGVSLALDEAPEGVPAVELVPVDLAGGGTVRRQVEELRSSGVAAIVGPVRSDELVEAGRAAGDLPVLSPTATTGPVGPLPTYALWDRERRELDAAGALGRWLGRALRPPDVAVLYPATGIGRRSFIAFRRGLGAAGGGVAAATPYDPDATTIEEPIRSVAAFRPSVVFVPAQGTGSVLQLAPQLSYYGVRGTVVAGSVDWSEPAAVRRVEPSFTQLRLAPTYLDRGEGGGWARFTERYERTYRKSLGANVLPGLGHDAALLLLRALRETRPARPRALARALAGLEGVEGATGVLAPDAPTGTVTREVEVRELGEMELTAISPRAVREWLAQAGELASTQGRRRRARALQAVREADIEAEAGEGPGGQP